MELVSLAVLAAGGGIVAWLTDDPKPTAGAAASPEPIDLPGLPDATAPVLMPGRPGEAARTTRADEVSPMPRPSYNAADVRFVTRMIPHHEQALVMARLVADRAASPKIKVIADRILAAQGPEIAVLEDWLAVRRLPRNPAAGHPPGMVGMQSPEALTALGAAHGAAFDRMFVEMMTDHHRGAIDMAQEAVARGTDGTINELATSVVAEQTVEIGRLREALSSP